MNKRSIDAIVIVDMQENFLRYFNSTERSHLISMQLEMLDVSRKMKVPVIALEFKGYGNTIKIIDKEIRKNKQYDFLKKEDMNGFYNPNLKTKLQEWDVENICLMGILAYDCVMATARGAMSNRFGIFSAGDIIADFNPDAMENAKKWFNLNGIYLPSYRDAISYLDKKS